MLDDQSRSNYFVGSAFFFYVPIALCSAALLLGLTGCAAPLAALGATSTAAASTVGSSAVTVAVANPSTAVSAVSTVTTGKSPLEHAASAATKQDCSFLNAVVLKPICVDVPIPKVRDHSEPYPGPADTAASNTKN